MALSLYPHVAHAKARYFEIIGEKIRETTFDSPQEQQILTLYFEGFKCEEIKKRLMPPVHRHTVYRKLEKWLTAWGLK